MRMIAAAVALTLSLATAARADFVVNNSGPAASAPQANVAAPATPPPQPTSQTDPDTADQAPTPPPPRFKMAYGFGDQVPLSFACKQIVPNAVRVSYGPGASPSQLVSWKGGDTWNHVLRNAVKPLGLQLVMTHMAVEIRR